MAGLTVHPTTYGRAADEQLHALVGAVKARDLLAPATVVVPTNSVGVAARRSLGAGRHARGRGIAGLTVLTVYRLAELLGAPSLAAAGRRPVSTPVLTAAVRRMLADDPGIFRDVVSHPATEASLVEAHRELSDCSAVTLDALSATGRRAADVIRVHRGIRHLLADGWYDEADLMEAATVAVQADVPMVADLGTLVVHLPQDVSPAAGRLLEAIAGRRPVEVVAGMTGVPAADADVVRSLARMGVTDEPRPAAGVQPGVDEVVSVSDAEEEVRVAAERVLAALQDGIPAERIAVVHPSPEPYAAIVATQFAAAGLPWNGQADRATTQRFAPRWLLDVLDLPRRRFGRAAVLGVLAGADRGRSRVLPMPLSTAERLSREAGVVEGVEGWMTRLTRLGDTLRAEADRSEGDEERPWLADARRRDADRADSLRALVVSLAADLEEGAHLSSWPDLVAWARSLVHDHLGDEHQRAGWPPAERDAADALEAALDRVAALDAIDPGTADPTALRATLELELDSGLGRSGTLGHGVLVGRPAAALGVDLDLVVVLGMAEGVFPSRPREDSLLAEHERAQVADELPPRSTRIQAQHRHLLAALAAARRRVMILPRGDLRRSAERVPSRWLLDAVEVTTGHRALDPRHPAVTVIPSFAAHVRSRPPCDEQGAGLRVLAGDATAGQADWLTPFRSGRRLLDARREVGLSPFAGAIGDAAAFVPSPASIEVVTSASRVQDWVVCPHAWLVGNVLGIRPVEDPEERVTISPRDLGSLVHGILDRWLAERIEEGPPSPGQAWSDAARSRLLELAEQRFDDAEVAGLTGHPQLWRIQRRGIVHDLVRFLHEDDQWRAQHAATPIGTEVAFGGRGSFDPLVLDLGDGRHVRFRGFVDRVDRLEDGTVVVTDYKTGSTRGYRSIGPESPTGDGSHLQLLVYGLAALQAWSDAPRAHADYLFPTERGEFSRIGYPVDRTDAHELARVVRLVVDHVEAGLFPLRPEPPGFRVFNSCVYCDPDDLGTADRYRDWERLRLLPELRDYVAQVEPDVLEHAADMGEGAS